MSKINENIEIGNTGYSLKNIVPKLLWTNSNPNNSFSAQNITLNSSDWDIYEIIYKNVKETYFLTNSRSLKGKNAILFATSGASQSNTRVREIEYINQTTLYIKDCANPGVAFTNDFCIPLYIIGYKTNLFS